MLLIDSDLFKQFVRNYGLDNFMSELVLHLESDFKRWDAFTKSPRHAVHVPDGVMELMPCSDGEYYAFKYVNGHPKNTQVGKLNIVAFGVLVEAITGVPCMFTAMTFLTAIRTACMSALVAKYGARASDNIGIIGCGSQSEFQILALNGVCDSKAVRFFDKDPLAMKKFAANLANSGLELIACSSSQEVAQNSEVLVTNIGFKGRVSLLEPRDLKPGQLIIAIGGDCPGKTELSVDILKQADQIWVEYQPQTQVEGEIQQWPEASVVEFHKIITANNKPKSDEIIIFDGVGFAIEDFSALTFLYSAISSTPVPEHYIHPETTNPKDLFGALNG